MVVENLKGWEMSGFIRLVLLFVLGCNIILVWASGKAKAQPSGYFKYKTAFEAAADGSPEKLDNLLKMIDVVFHYDLDIALQHADECVKLAKEYGNSDAEAAGLMDLAVWTAYKFGSGKAEHYLELAEEKFNKHGDPRFVAQYYSSRFGYSMVNEKEEYDPNQYLDEVLKAAEKVGDPHLMMSYLYMVATSKVFVGKLAPTEPSILEIRELLKEVTLANKFETGKINSLFLDAQEKRIANDSLGALMAFIKAAKYCKEKKYLLFEVRAKLVLGYIELQMGYSSFVDGKGSPDSWTDDEKAELAELMQPVRERYVDCLEIARAVKMSSYIFESLTQLAYLEYLCGDTEEAKRLITEAEGLEYECFRSWSLRDTLYRHALLVYANDGDSESALKYANLLASEEHRTKFREASEKSTRYSQEVALVTRKQKIESEKSVAIRKKLNANLDSEKTKIELAENRVGFTNFGLCLLGLLCALAWNRTRLAKIEVALSEERENSRINREINDSLQERVTRLQRMESLGMLAGGVAHDFNNLLVGVMCNAELLGMRQSEDEFSNARVQEIIASAEKAADLSRQMLAYAGKQQIKKRSTDIVKLTTRMERILSVAAGDKRDFEIESTDAELYAEIDSTQIEQILMNLVSNSSAASPEGSTIKVRCGEETLATEDLDSKFHGLRSEGGEFVTIEVEDEGAGFSDEQKDRIFEPFFSTRDKGRGLGLAVVYGIVNGHNGLIRVESSPEKSTRFRIYLPTAEIRKPFAPPRPHGLATQVAAATEKKCGTILVVDDEESVRNMASALLELNGWKVVLAKDGREALDQICKPESRLDCVLLDVVMPEMEAAEVLRILESKGIEIPIVVMSGFSESQLDQYRQNRQIVSIVAKPFKTADLMREIEYALSSSRAKPKRSSK